MGRLSPLITPILFALGATAPSLGASLSTSLPTLQCPRSLALAVDQDNLACARAWLKLGASPDSGVGHPLEDRPLLLAIQRGNPKMVELLFEAGARADAADRRGTPLLIHAVSSAWRDSSGRSFNALKALIHLSGVKGLAAQATLAKDRAWVGDGRSALHQAAALGATAILELLLRDLPSAHVDLANRYGETPLYSAAEHGHSQAVSMLLSRGARINTHTRFTRMTPLHAAAESGSVQTLELMLAADRSHQRIAEDLVVERNSFGKSAIDLARAAVRRVPASLSALSVLEAYGLSAPPR